MHQPSHIQFLKQDKIVKIQGNLDTGGLSPPLKIVIKLVRIRGGTQFDHLKRIFAGILTRLLKAQPCHLHALSVAVTKVR